MPEAAVYEDSHLRRSENYVRLSPEPLQWRCIDSVPEAGSVQCTTKRHLRGCVPRTLGLHTPQRRRRACVRYQRRSAVTAPQRALTRSIRRFRSRAHRPLLFHGLQVREPVRRFGGDDAEAHPQAETESPWSRIDAAGGRGPSVCLLPTLPGLRSARSRSSASGLDERQHRPPAIFIPTVKQPRSIRRPGSRQLIQHPSPNKALHNWPYDAVTDTQRRRNLACCHGASGCLRQKAVCGHDDVRERHVVEHGIASQARRLETVGHPEYCLRKRESRHAIHDREVS